MLNGIAILSLRLTSMSDKLILRPTPHRIQQLQELYDEADGFWSKVGLPGQVRNDPLVQPTQRHQPPVNVS